jgi:hypothetical protein
MLIFLANLYLGYFLSVDTLTGLAPFVIFVYFLEFCFKFGLGARQANLIKIFSVKTFQKGVLIVVVL